MSLPPPPPPPPQAAPSSTTPTTSSTTANIATTITPLASASATPTTAITTSPAENNGHVKVSAPAVPCPVSNGAGHSITTTTTDRAADAELQLQNQQQLREAQAPPSSVTQPLSIHTTLAAHPAATMIFSDLYKGPRSPLARLRQHNPQLPSQFPTTTPDWVSDEHADLLSRDKVKQKEAVKRYLITKVRNDWQFQWPPVPPTSQDTEEQQSTSQSALEPAANGATPEIHDESRHDDGYLVDDGSELGEEPSDQDDEDSDDDAESVYSVVSEDAVHYRPRMEWTSDLSDDEAPTPSPYRFDSPEAVGLTVQASILEKRARRRRAVREEIIWNEGLACFEARRNGWTGARTVRVRTKPVTPPPVSPRSPRRFFFRRSMSGSPPSSTVIGVTHMGEGGSSTTSDTSSIAKDHDLKKQGSKDLTQLPTRLLPVETLLPVAQPILPPNNPLRASITPSVYLNLYDKVILSNLQPSCPINLSDMLRSCVSGWRRDGEWPPRPSAPDPTVVAMRKKKPKKAATGPNEPNGTTARRMSLGLLGRGGDDESRTGKGIRKSLQRALGFGPFPGSPET